MDASKIVPFASRARPAYRPSRPDLTAPANDIFEGRELLHADRSARMQFSGADADFRSHAELASVGILRRGVPENNGRVQCRQKSLRSVFVGGDNALGVLRAEF